MIRLSPNSRDRRRRRAALLQWLIVGIVVVCVLCVVWALIVGS